MKQSLNRITQYRWAGLLTSLLLLAVACGGANQTPVKTRSTSGSKAVKSGTMPVVAGDSSSPSGTVPELDRSIHRVPLNQNLFDTFGTARARFVPVSEISDALQAKFRDAITVVVLPAYGALDALPFGWMMIWCLATSLAMMPTPISPIY